MYNKLSLTAMIAFLLILSTISPAFAQHGVDHYTGDWRLPFSGVQSISNGPGEGMHTGASSEAIDYPTSFFVYAPADGYILDVINASDFGWTLRIVHTDFYDPGGVVSFFAHMQGNSVSNWHSGDVVTRGQYIGISSNSGTGASSGAHLHFEARTGAVQGQVYSGQSIPIRAIPGQWWNKWYSPTPNFQHDVNQFSGGAQSPESYILPAGMPATGNPRHLANFESPSAIPAVHFSDLASTSIYFHMGGSPSTPGNAQYSTSFEIAEYVTGSGWQCPVGCATANPTFSRTVNSSNQCTPSNQHCYTVWSYNSLRGWSDYRTFYFHTGNTATRQPYIVASYDRNADIAVLTYDSPGATYFSVWQDTPDPAPPSGIYAGPAKSIRVRHQSNRSYMVSAWSSSQGWSPWSIWLVP